LIDHFLGTSTNLKEAAYTFASSETIQANRFTVVFNDSLLNTDEFATANGLQLFPNPANGQITLSNQNDIVGFPK